MRHLEPSEAASPDAGFTLIEILAVVALLGLLLGVVAPNLMGLVPSARLDGSAKTLQAKIADIRSESRIQAKRMQLELDLDKGRFRVILPPEERLTSDQEIERDEDLADDRKDWIDLETGVVFAGAGTGKDGLVEKGFYRVTFDEYGFSADQVIALRLENDPTMVWTLSIRGLTGMLELHRSEDGQIFYPTVTEEGAF
ncbi:MAG TPA: prepilin-type N-terminal cleavage/methylation domain-containing protein [bacterium]|nr:prepilin-type N-terminal cleavage/methylation domain-containing protein [bacterium]